MNPKRSPQPARPEKKKQPARNPLLKPLYLAVFAALALIPRGQRLPASWSAGWALVEISPSSSTPLAGYSARQGRLAQGSRDPIMARVLVLQDPAEKRAALVSCDLIGISSDLRDAVLKEVPERLGFGPENLVLSATHSHSGPGGICSSALTKGACGDYDDKVFRELAARIASALRQAAGSLVPAELFLSQGSIQGLVRNRRRASGLVETELGVLRVRLLGGPEILLVQAAVHPTILSPSNLKYSADFPGALVKNLEGRGYAALFMNGALGDQAPVATEGADESARVEAYGERLADRVLHALADNSRELKAGLSARSFQVPLPGTVFSAWLPARAQVQALELGDHVLFSVPGEPVAEVGRNLRARARALGYASAWILGLANDHLGYFDTLAGFKANSYESILTFHGPGSSTALLAALPPPSRPTGAKAPSPAKIPRKQKTGSRERRGDAWFLRVSGTPAEMGFQHGTLLKEEIQAFYAGFQAWLDREISADLGRRWKVPDILMEILRPSAPALPWLCLKARELLPLIDPGLVEEMEALSRGADLPFDAVLLMNVFLTMAEQPDLAGWFSQPPAATCTNLTCLPPWTGGGILQARNLDWAMSDLLPRFSTVILHEPSSGFPFVSVGWAGLVGTLTAMNNQGLSITEESVASPEDSRFEGEPLMLLLRRVIQHSSSLDQAVGELRNARGTCGYHVSVASAADTGARVVELSARKSALRFPRGGLLPGVSLEREPSNFEGGILPPPELPRSDPASDRRYAGLSTWLQGRSGGLTPEILMGLLREKAGGISNPKTLHSVVLDPGRFRAWIAQGRTPASDGAFVPYEFSRELSRHRLSGPARARFEKAFGPSPAWAEALRPTPVRLESLEVPSPGRPYGLRLLRMASTVHSPHPENNILYARLYEPVGPVLATLLFLPMWQGREKDAEDLISRNLACRGFRVALMPQAYQWRRSPPGVRSGNYLLSPDVELTRTSLIQSLADAERLGAWLSATTASPGKRLGIIGLSLGAFAASALFSLDSQFGAGVLILGGAEAGLALGSTAPDLRDFRQALIRRGMKPEDLPRTFAFLDPAGLADVERCSDMLLVNGLFDGVVTYDNARRLREAYGGAEQVWLPAGHHSAVLFLDEVADRTAEHFRSRLCP